jgi:recombination associated protein RdgC
MGALDGSMTVTRFYIDAQIPNDFRARYLEAIRRNAFEPLKPDSEEDKRQGWVSIYNPLDSAFKTHNDIFMNEYMCLGLRMDRWSLPTLLLKARLKEAMSAYLKSSGQERASHGQRAAIKQQVTRVMREQTIPNMKVIDMAWNINQGSVKLWTHGKGQVDGFMALFEHTFGIQLIPDSPYTAAIALGISDEAQAQLLSIEPTTFSPDERA